MKRAFDPVIKPGHPDVPSIPVAIGYDEHGRENKVKLVPFQEGMEIERFGKRYRLDKHGTQRRIE